MAQSILSGIVKSSDDSIPLASVTIFNKQSGYTATSDDRGTFSIGARKGDTILLKRIGYTPLLYIVTKERSGIHLMMKPQPIGLQQVNVIQYHFLRDSLRLRDEFRRSFDFRRPRWNEVIPFIGFGFAININQLSRALAFKSNRHHDKFKALLLAKEQENMVEKMFSPELIIKLTGMDNDSLTQFMRRYEPGYDFVKNASAYDLYVYIRQCYIKFASGADSSSVIRNPVP